MDIQPAVLVVGLHKTGTTIISHTILNSLQGAEFSMEPKTIAHFEELGRKPGAKVVKILFNHWNKRPNLLDGLITGETGFVTNRNVAIIRDPRDSAISKMFYQVYGLVEKGASRKAVESWIRVVEHKQQNPDSVAVTGMLEEMNRIFGLRHKLSTLVMKEFEEYTGWINRHGEISHVLRYEDFVGNRLDGLERYLGFPLTERRDVPQSVQRVRRSSGSGNWKTMMLPSDIALLREECGEALAAYGYDDWALAAEPCLEPAHGSEYVRRITEEAYTLIEARKQQATKVGLSGTTEKPALSWSGRSKFV